MKSKHVLIGGICGVALLAAVGFGLSGCATLDRAYRTEVAMTNAPVVEVRTNIVLVPSTVKEPGGTNLVTVFETNFVPVFATNYVQVPVTNLVASPGVVATIDGTGAVINTFAPGIGSIVALALGGLYHGYRQVRNRRVNEALVQGVETARAVLTTTPQGQAADAQLVKWLMDHQKEAGVFAVVSRLVDEVSDNPAAKMTAQEIAQRVERATKVAADRESVAAN